MHLAIVAPDGLRAMPPCRYGEVHGQDGVGVDQQLKLIVYHLLHLLLGTVLLTKEAGSAADGFPVYVGSRANDACGVELYDEYVLPKADLLLPRVSQILISFTNVPPF